MIPPLGLQLFTIREALATDFAAATARVAEIGYVGVEPALGTLGTSARRAATLFEELGLVVPSVHAPLPLGDEQSQVLDETAALGSGTIISGLGPHHFGTIDLIRQACDVFNEACRVTADNGMSFGIHNHWWEFGLVGGQYAYRVMLEHLDPRIFFQIDTYWVRTAGCDPVDVLVELGSRVPMLHIKDGPALKDAPMVPIGQGLMDFRRILRSAGDNTEWMIVELDRSATDMMLAVELSYQYLVGEGFARGAHGTFP